jgi:hypothetical protein
MRRTFAIGLTLVTPTVLSSPGQEKPSQQSRWRAHVEALANDGMEGRNTGNPAHKRAGVSQFQKAGLEPAGVGGYSQTVASSSSEFLRWR